MRDFSFVKTDQPTMAEFNKRFGDIAYVINNLGSEYVWHKTKTAAQLVLAAEAFQFLNAQYGGQINLTVYQTATPNLNGTVTVSDAVTYRLNAGTDNTVLLNKYYNYNGTIYRVSNYSFPTYEERVYLQGYAVTSKSVLTSYGYVNSPDPNAYPIDDGFTYTALGQLGDKTRMLTGSYKGTGTCGTENPNRLTFPFTPKVVIVYSNSWPQWGSYGWKAGGFIWVNSCTKDKIDYNSSGDAFYLWFAMNDNTLTYNLGAANLSSYSQTLGGMAPAFQCNDSSTTYNYIALG